MRTKATLLALVVASALAFVTVSGLTRVSSSQNFGVVALAAGFSPNPRILGGTSGGRMRASQLDGACEGWISSQPDHHMHLNSAFEFLRVYVQSGGDTTLIIRGPLPETGVRCNDDRYGTNPAIEGTWAAGLYHIWVGSHGQGDLHTYEIGFTTQRETH